MPSHIISTAIYQPLQIATANVTVRLTVSAVDTDKTVAQQWYRHYLASASAAGTGHTVAVQTLAYLQTLFAGAWLVRMAANGKVEITNTAGTWSINWTAAHANGAIIRNILGWDANIGSTAASTYAQADHHPSHTIYLINRSDDTGWMPEFTGVAAQNMPDGTVYEFNSGYVQRSRTFESQFHPYESADIAGLSYTTTDGHATNIEGAVGRRQQPSATMTTTFTNPWSVADTVFTAGQRELGVAFGDFQSHVSGSTTTYDKCYLDASSRKALQLALTQRNWSRSRNIRGWKLRWNASATRS